MTLRRVFTLFSCLIVISFIIFGPGYLNNNRVDTDESYGKRNGKKSDWKGIITVWDYPRIDLRNNTRFSWIKSKIKQFEKENPGVYIEFRELDMNQGHITLMAAAKTGAVPDIAPVGSDYYYQSRKMLEDISKNFTLDEISDFEEKYLQTVMYDDKIYGIPWMTTGYTMLLNKDIFSDRDVPLPENGNWTYEEFVDSMKKLTYDTNRRKGADVFGFNTIIQPGHYNSFGILLSDGAEIIDRETGKYVFDSNEALYGLKKLYDLKYVHKVTHPSLGNLNERSAWSSFINGRVAAYTADSWMIPYLRTMQSQNRINFAIANYPTGIVGKPVAMNSITCSYGLFNQTDKKKRELCIQFIKLLTAKENQTELLNFGYFPVRKSGVCLYENDKEMYAIQQSLSMIEPLPKHPYWYEIDLILQSKILAAINGELTPEKALEEAKEQIGKYINMKVEK